MQAAVFEVLGVTWFVYCLHAAVVNGMFAVLVVALLRRLGAPVVACAYYGVLSAIVFYPPFGVPYPDQHAFFFSLALVYAATPRRCAPRRALGQDGWGAGLPLLRRRCTAQQATSERAGRRGVSVWLIARAVRGDRRSLAIPAGSAAAIVALALAAVVLLKMPTDEILYYGFRLPSDDMGVRVGNISTWVGLRGRHARIWPQIGQHSPALVHLAGLAVLAAWCWTRWSRVRADVLRAAGLWVLAECLFLVTLLFVYLTNNQPRNGLAFQPVATGLAHMAALVWLSAGRAERVRAAIALAISTPFVVVATLDAWRFNSEVNAVRSVHDQLWARDRRRWPCLRRWPSCA